MYFILVLALYSLVLNCWASIIPIDTSKCDISKTCNEAGDFLAADCGHEFIEMTPKNLEESGVKDWYAKWTEEAKVNDSLYTQHGEVKYFGMKYLQDEDYNCGLSFDGCNRRPSWCNVYKMYSKDPETARRVYLATKLQNMVNLITKVIYDSVLAAQVHADGLVDAVIRTYTQQTNAESEVKCAILKASIAALVQVAIDASVKAISKNEEASKAIGDTYKAIMGTANWHKIAVQAFGSWGKTESLFFFNREFDEMNICDTFGGGFDPQNQNHIAALHIQVGKFVGDFRDNFSNRSERVNKGSFVPEVSSPSELSELMFNSTWANETLTSAILDNPYQIEKQFKTMFSQYLVSNAARSSGCYLKCNTQPDAQLYCHDKRDDLDKIRFCPKMHKVCQLECRTQQSHATEEMFWGFDQLDKEPFNLDIQKEMRNAYESFKVFGNHPVSDFGEALEGGNPSLFRLPVCDSDAGYVDITDFKHGGFLELFVRQTKNFPASCGTWRSNGVQDFMKFIGLDTSSAAFKQGHLNHFYIKRLVEEIDNVIRWPLDKYLAYCEHGMRFPEWTGMGTGIINEVGIGESKHCGTIKSITQNLTHLDANIEFCTGNYKWHLLDENKRISTDGMNVRGSRQHCQSMLKFLVEEYPEWIPGREANAKWDKFYWDHLWELGGWDSW